MQCPNCGSENVQVQIVERGQQTNKKGVGFGGRANNKARKLVGRVTFGTSNLFWKESHGTNKTTTINDTMGICQACGNTWVIDEGKTGIAPGSIFK